MDGDAEWKLKTPPIVLGECQDVQLHSIRSLPHVAFARAAILVGRLVS